METLTTSYSLTAQLKVNTDERSEWKALDFFCPSLVEMSIDYDEKDIKTYRAVELRSEVAMDGCTGGLQVRFGTGDVVQDFNNAGKLINEMELIAEFLPSVLSYALASVGTCATMGRGVTIFWDFGSGPMLRAALPSEYLTPGKPLSKARII